MTFKTVGYCWFSLFGGGYHLPMPPLPFSCHINLTRIGNKVDVNAQCMPVYSMIRSKNLIS